MKKIFAIITTFLTANKPVTKKFIYDKNKSWLTFNAIHPGISKVEGSFKVFDASLKSQKEDFSDAYIEMRAVAKSINTEINSRDTTLRGSDWFNVEKYPFIIFRSTSLKKITDEDYIMDGNVTIHGITKPIKYNVIYKGENVDTISKKHSIRFAVKGKLNRDDFNIGMVPFKKVVSDVIEVNSTVEFIKG
jgi:polyisoprenoid-binding protein YceI